MRLSKRISTHSQRMDMTPMIDVVFLLIIFFMVVSQVTQANRQPLELPEEEGAHEQEPTTLIVNIDQTGQIIVSGDEVQIDALIRRAADALRSVGGDPQLLTVTLRCDRRAASRTANDVVVALQRLGINRIRVAVQSGT